MDHERGAFKGDHSGHRGRGSRENQNFGQEELAMSEAMMPQI
jgi:hypothetical protein